MTQQITAQLLKGGLTVDASGNISATKLIGALQGNVTGDLLGDVTGNVTGELKTGTIKASDDTLAITITDSTGKVTLAGDLIVSGTTTTINSTTLTVDDKNIELGSVATPTDTTADGGGITLKGATDKTILWSNSTDTWDFNQGINIEGATSNLATFTSDLTIAANYSMAIIGPVTIPNVTVNGNLNVMTKLDVTGNFNISSTGFVNIIG